MRERLRPLPLRRAAEHAARMRTGHGTAEGDPTHATKTAMRSLGRRVRLLTQAITSLDQQLGAPLPQVAPALTAMFAVSTHHAAQLLITAGGNADRIHSEAAFAALCGTNPIPASSGKSRRHRLNRAGDRDANRALHMIAVLRMRWHEPTRTYVARRTAEGLSKKEILRCLKRYIAREAYHAVRADLTP